MIKYAVPSLLVVLASGALAEPAYGVHIEGEWCHGQDRHSDGYRDRDQDRCSQSEIDHCALLWSALPNQPDLLPHQLEPRHLEWCGYPWAIPYLDMVKSEYWHSYGMRHATNNAAVRAHAEPVEQARAEPREEVRAAKSAPRTQPLAPPQTPSETPPYILTAACTDEIHAAVLSWSTVSGQCVDLLKSDIVLMYERGDLEDCYGGSTELRAAEQFVLSLTDPYERAKYDKPRHKYGSVAEWNNAISDWRACVDYVIPDLGKLLGIGSDVCQGAAVMGSKQSDTIALACYAEFGIDANSEYPAERCIDPISKHRDFWTVHDVLREDCAWWLSDALYDANQKGLLRDCDEGMTDARCDARRVADLGKLMGAGSSYCTGHAMSLMSPYYQISDIRQMEIWCLAESNDMANVSYSTSDSCNYDLYTVMNEPETMSDYCQRLLKAEYASLAMQGVSPAEGCTRDPKSDECIVNGTIQLANAVGIREADDICLPRVFEANGNTGFGRTHDLVELCRETIAPDWWYWILGWLGGTG